VLDSRLVIVSVNYRPEETGIAPYATAMAEHFAACGATVTALVGMPHYPGWRIFPEFRGRLQHRSNVNGVDVRRLWMYVPKSQSALRRALYEGTFLSHAMGFLAQARIRGTLGRIDAVIGVIPGLSGGIVAASLARRHHCSLGIVVQDLVGAGAAQSGIPGGDRVASVTRGVEGWVVRRASEVAIVSDGFRGFLRDQGVPDQRVHSLPNWTRTAQSQRTTMDRASLGWGAATVVLHAGNMGLKQGLGHILAAARACVESHPNVLFVFMGDGSQRRMLEEQAVGLPNVVFMAPRYEEEFAAVLSSADILLLSERKSVHDMSMPSKLTSYFAAGRPVLASVALGGITAQEVVRSGGGIVVEAEDSIALLRGVDRLVSTPAYAQTLSAAGREYAREHLGEAAGLARSEAFATRLLEREPAREGQQGVSVP
jgi:colanic acid biosynthesis glycosyl transferase WcaI